MSTDITEKAPRQGFTEGKILARKCKKWVMKCDS